MSLEAEDERLRDGAERRQGPGRPQQQPRAVRGHAVRDREHRGAEPGHVTRGTWSHTRARCSVPPVHGDGHEDVAGEEVPEDPEGDHELAREPVRPPGHGRFPGDLQRDGHQDDLVIGHCEEKKF